MKNQKLSASIASMVALSLALHPLRAQTSVTDATPSGPVAPSAAATTSSPSPGATISATKTSPAHTMPYTVVTGDTLTKLADRFNTTRKKLKALNELAGAKLTPGQVILVPASAKKLAAAKAKRHYLAAQPVQDFDIPASNFASCPVPVPSDDEDANADSFGGKPAPVAALVSPSEMAADESKQRVAAEIAAQSSDTASSDGDGERLSASIAPPRLSLPPTPALKPVPKVAMTSAKPKTAPSTAPSGWANDSGHRFATSSSTPAPSSGSHFWSFTSGSHGGSGDLSMNTPAYSPANEWGFKFLQASRALGDRGIDYDDDWRPPGERSSWVMDCSNTSRWLYKSVAGINLPRTASDQYYYLHQQGKAWDVPTGPTGWADVDYLQKHLKPGDLLFWQNTYRPERQPPITHVMVFLGTNERGQWIMSGSQSSRGGEHNRRDGGPDVYVFRPSQACGGYTSWFVHHTGRFCAFGRPLEADPSKLAADD